MGLDLRQGLLSMLNLDLVESLLPMELDLIVYLFFLWFNFSFFFLNFFFFFQLLPAVFFTT